MHISCLPAWLSRLPESIINDLASLDDATHIRKQAEVKELSGNLKETNIDSSISLWSFPCDVSCSLNYAIEKRVRSLVNHLIGGIGCIFCIGFLVCFLDPVFPWASFISFIRVVYMLEGSSSISINSRRQFLEKPISLIWLFCFQLCVF